VEKEHTQSVVGRGAALEDMFGLEHESEALEDPGAFTYQTVGEVSLEMKRRYETDKERRAFLARRMALSMEAPYFAKLLPNAFDNSREQTSLPARSC
jgi:hypothetical protein